MLGNQWMGTWLTLAVCTWPPGPWHKNTLLFPPPRKKPVGASKTYVKPLVMP